VETCTVHAATDVSGFGLAGHLFEMARSSDVSVRINWDQVPVLPEAQRMYERGITTGMNAPNWERVEKSVWTEGRWSSESRSLLVDPQTNGGLLAALPGDEADRALEALQEAGVREAKCIGDVCPPSHTSITFIGGS
jgi:selenide,water dikinase